MADDTEHTAEEARRTLDAHSFTGWKVSCTATEDSVECQFTHQRSAGFAIQAKLKDADSLSRTIEHHVSSNIEFVIVEASPRVSPHSNFLQDLRGIARAYKWTNVEVQGLALLLREHSIVTGPEASWLAGYVGIGAPLQPRSLESGKP